MTDEIRTEEDEVIEFDEEKIERERERLEELCKEIESEPLHDSNPVPDLVLCECPTCGHAHPEMTSSMNGQAGNEGETEAEEAKSSGPRFKKGDVVRIIGLYIAEVVQVYPNYETARENYEYSYDTILKKGLKWKENDYHYLCLVANSTHAPIGVAERDAEFKE